MKSDYWFSVLDPSTVKIIRRYRLNKQGHRVGRRNKLQWRQMGVHANMLVPVPITRKKPLKDKINACLKMSLLNAQSIWDKVCVIVDYFLSNNINIAIITESWLQNTAEDACRLSTYEFITGLFSAIPSNRQDNWGGILPVHKKSYKADLLEEVFTHSFQAAKFKVQVNKCNITLLAIYHPPYSAVNPVTEKNVYWWFHWMDMWPTHHDRTWKQIAHPGWLQYPHEWWIWWECRWIYGCHHGIRSWTTYSFPNTQSR